MSSVIGGGFRGRGRGSLQSTPSRGRGSSMPGEGIHNNASRGATAPRSTFGLPSRSDSPRAPRSSTQARPRTSPAEPGAFGTARSRGSWQDRYQNLTRARERERSDAIRQGLIADPDKPRSLSEAITPLGTCQDMCAEYERVQRVVQKDVWDEETDTQHSPFAATVKEPDEARMVKKFRRAAAGLEEQLPSDLRPPNTLKRTCDYLFDVVIGDASSLAHVHHFVWDRTRAIRNDFSIQQVTKPEELRTAIDCYERIARFHIVSLHQLALPEKAYSKYDWQQEREQLDRTLLSLMQYYDDSNGRIELPNEAEFRAYCVIFQLQDPTPDLEDRVQTWPKRIIQNKRVQTATEIYMAACNVMDVQGPLKPRATHLIARQDWQRFWTLIASKEVSYLMACVAEIYFNLVRRMVLNALFRSFRMNSNLATPDWTIDALCELLAFDNGDEVYNYCEKFGFGFKEREDGEQYLDLASVKGRTLPEPSAGIPKQTKSTLVEDKRFGRTLPAVIDGLVVQQARISGLVHHEVEDGMEDVANHDIVDRGSIEDVMNAKDEGDDEEDSLFIPTTKTPSVVQSSGLSTFAHAKSDKQLSIFAGGLTGGSTFGKPSNFSEQPTGTAPITHPLTGQNPIPNLKNELPKISLFKPLDPGTGKAPASPFESFRTSGNNAEVQKDSAPKLSPFTQPQSAPDSGLNRPASKGNGSSFSFGLSTEPALSRPSPNPHSITKSQDGITKNASFAPSFTSNHQEVKSPSFGQAKVQLTSQQPAEAPVQPPAPSPSSQPPETTGSQHHFTSPSTSPTLPASINNTQVPSLSNTGLGVKRASFSADTKPKKPSPLSSSITAGDDPSAREAEHSPKHQAQVGKRIYPTPERVAAEEFDSLITRLAEELVHNPHDGFMKQYIHFIVNKTLIAVRDQVIAERNIQEADEYRHFRLCERYGKRWRDLFWQRRLAKAGRERRERRQRILQGRRSQGVEDGSFCESQSGYDSSTAGSFLDDTRRGDLNDRMEMGTSTSKPFAAAQVSAPQQLQKAPPIVTSSKRPASSHSVDAAVPSREPGHKRLKSTSHVDGHGPITKPGPVNQPGADILKRSSFLGFSLTQAADGTKTNTTMSNYFRLKAMGVNRADNASGLRGTKRPFSESVQHSVRTSPPALRSSSWLETTPKHSTTNAAIPPPSSMPQPLSMGSDNDEELFARLRAAREGLKQSVSLFKTEADSVTELRRSKGSQPALEPPSMMRARANAKSSVYQSASESGLSSDRTVPAYRLRESKFVPREHYTKAIARADSIRASRSREPSRPESPADDGDDEQFAHKNRGKITSSHVRARSAKTNGLLNTSAFPACFSAHQSAAQPSISQFTAPLTFSNHTTQMPLDNPFLQSHMTGPMAGFTLQPTFAFDKDPQKIREPEDQTIKPSQVQESLAKSFESSLGSGRVASWNGPQYSPAAPQPDSCLQSQAMSFLSEEDLGAFTEGQAQPGIGNQLEIQYTADELLDNATEEDCDDFEYPYLQASSHVSQAQDTGDDDTDSGNWDGEDGDGRFVVGGEGANRYKERLDGGLNGFRHHSSEDEGAADGDIDEEESDELDDEEEYDGLEEEDGDGDEEDESGADEHGHSHAGQWQPRAGYNAWTPGPEKNAALQDVGGTVEEAIELSD